MSFKCTCIDASIVLCIYYIWIILTKEAEECFALLDVRVVGSIYEGIRLATLVEVATILSSECCIPARVKILVGKFLEGIRDRSHTSPRTSKSLDWLAHYRVEDAAAFALCLHVTAIVPLSEPAYEVLRSATVTPAVACTIVLLAVESVVSPEHPLCVTVILEEVYVTISLLKLVRARVVDSSLCHIECLLVVRLSLARVTVGSSRICVDAVRVLKPPSIGQVSLCEIETSHVLGDSTNAA